MKRFSQTMGFLKLCISWSRPGAPHTYKAKGPRQLPHLGFQFLSSMSESSRMRNVEGICWKCKKKLDQAAKFFCVHCGVILPLQEDENYFTILEVPRTFQLTISQLQRKFKTLQEAVHPDKFSLKDCLEKEISADISSQLNQAYATLLKPLTRGIYLLELEGITMGEEVTADDPEVLSDIMEMNEQIAEMTSVEEFCEAKIKVERLVNSLANQIEGAFRSSSLSMARTLLIKLKYYGNILSRLNEKMQDV